MPYAPAIACPCGARRQRGQACPVCGAGKRANHARTTHQRGYGSDWQKFRDYMLRTSESLCRDCQAEARVTASAELHHKQKIKNAPHLRLDPSNVVGLCRHHHQLRSAKGE